MVEELGTTPWSGTASRHTSPGRQPLSGAGARQFGARWNAAEGTPTIYLASPEETCRLELVRLIERQGSSVRLPREVHTVAVEEVRVLDLRDRARLAAVGLTAADLDADDWEPCQNVGEAAAYLEFQGIIARSATDVGEVLAVFENRITIDQLIVLDSIEVDWGLSD